MAKKSEDIEIDRRVRIIQEWLIDDLPVADIKTECERKWLVRTMPRLFMQGERYLKNG